MRHQTRRARRRRTPTDARRSPPPTGRPDQLRPTPLPSRFDPPGEPLHRDRSREWPRRVGAGWRPPRRPTKLPRRSTRPPPRRRGSSGRRRRRGDARTIAVPGPTRSDWQPVTTPPPTPPATSPGPTWPPTPRGRRPPGCHDGRSSTAGPPTSRPPGRPPDPAAPRPGPPWPPTPPPATTRPAPRTPRPAARHRHEPGQRPLVARRHQGRRPHLADGRAERLGPLHDQPRIGGRTARTDQPPRSPPASSHHASTDCGDTNTAARKIAPSNSEPENSENA